MPIAKVFNMAGEKIGEIELSEAIFGVEPNKSVLHDSVKNHCYDRGKGCTSNLEVQPSWGIVFYLDLGQQFLVSPAAALIFRISTAFRIF